MKKVLIIGGTGTLGKALVKTLTTQFETLQIHIFSRDENKQKALKKDYPNLICHTGDICDRDDLIRIAQHKYSYVYHCAAMKHVEVCENHVNKAHKINFSGTKNVYWILGKYPSVKFIFFSTDKAVAPINVYGYTKAISEKYLLEMNAVYNNVYIFRWGNILGSTGSVIHLIMDNLLKGKPVPITDVNMTRFWLQIEEAVDFVMHTIASKPPGSYWPIYIRSSSLLSLVKEVASILRIIDYEIEDIGIRPGEKIHEAMIADKNGVSVESSDYNVFTPHDLNQILYPLVNKLRGDYVS